MAKENWGLEWGPGHDEGMRAFNQQNYKLAHEILLPLAEKGDAEAQCIIGNLYHLGLAIERDELEAVKWYKKAAENGYPVAAHNLGTLFMTGTPPVQYDLEQAMKYFKMARDLGFEQGPNPDA